MFTEKLNMVKTLVLWIILKIQYYHKQNTNNHCMWHLRRQFKYHAVMQLVKNTKEVEKCRKMFNSTGSLYFMVKPSTIKLKASKATVIINRKNYDCSVNVRHFLSKAKTSYFWLYMYNSFLKKY